MTNWKQTTHKNKKSEKVKVNNGWKETTLGEVAVFNYGKGLPTKKRKAGDVPVYGSSGVTGLHSEALIDEPGYIIGRKGTVGSIHYSDQPFYPIDTVYYLTKQDIECDFRFFYYLLQTLGLDKLNFDSAVPGLNRGMAYSLKITIPKTEAEQKAIAAVLSSFDDKIELLRRQNRTLEQIAQATFKEWFVNFKINGQKLKINPETGLPEGWRQKGLDEIADFLNGLAMQKYPPENKEDELPVIKIRELKSGITGQTDKASKKITPEYIVDNGDVLFSWSGSLDVVLWCYGKGALNQHLFKVTSKKYPKWFYYHWILEHLPFFKSIAEAKATTMGHIQRHHLAEALVAVPDDDFMAFGDSKISPVFEHIISNNSQIQTLSKLRSVLLPKLMKGEIKVKGMDRFVSNK